MNGEFNQIYEFSLFTISPIANWEFFSGLILGSIAAYFRDGIKALYIKSKGQVWFDLIHAVVGCFGLPIAYGIYRAWAFIDMKYVTVRSEYLNASGRQYVDEHWWFPNSIYDFDVWSTFFVGFLVMFGIWILIWIGIGSAFDYYSQYKNK